MSFDVITSRGEINPQYAYILPSFFKITMETQRLARESDAEHLLETGYARNLARFAWVNFEWDAEYPGLDKEHIFIKALQYFGLNFKGDDKDWLSTIRSSLESRTPLKAIRIFVNDEQRASKYVHLIKVVLATKLIRPSAQLGEALRNYELIYDYNLKEDEQDPKYKPIFEAPWVKGRLRFRRQVVEAHEDQLVSLILED